MKTSIIILSLLLFLINPVLGQLSGNYTIDPGKIASPNNYQDFGSAVSDLVNGKRNDGGPTQGKGISGPVIFKVATDTYFENIVINPIKGVSTQNTILFESASLDSSKVILDDTFKVYDPYMVTLNCDYISFKGIGFSRTKGGSVFRIIHGTSHFSLIRNSFYTSDQNSYLITDDCSVVSDIAISENRFQNGNYGINFCGDTIKNDSGLIIDHNIFLNVGYPIQLNHQGLFYITNNKINGTKSQTINGVNVYFSSGPGIIKNNKIDISSIHAGRGIWIPYFSPIGKNRLLIADNMISMHCSVDYTDTKGIETLASNNVDIIYNTVLLDSFYSNYSADLKMQSCSNFRVFNNCFVNRVGICSIYFLGILSNLDSCDYNNLSSNRNSFATLWDTTFYYSLQSYYNATGFDLHSVSLTPFFISEADLHNRNYVLNAKARPLSFVKDDIDGKLRDQATPDIGADENYIDDELAGLALINPPPNVCVNKLYPFAICFRNNGTRAESHFKIGINISGIPASNFQYIFTDTIKPGAVDTFFFPSKINFSAIGDYKAKGYVSLTNDFDKTNDTVFSIINAITTTKPMFTYSNPCQNNPILFTNTTKDSTLKYFWTFGDGDTSLIKNPFHSFGHTASYKVLLRATNLAGCSDTGSSIITPFPSQYSRFTFSNTGKGAIQFTTLDSGFKTYYWDFGDGNITNQINPLHTYKKVNLYTATLIVSNKYGCIDSVSELIKINNANIETDYSGTQIISIYPQPITTYLRLVLSHDYGPIMPIISLLDFNGRVIMENIPLQINCKIGELYTFEMKDIHLKSGIYYLKIIYNNKEGVLKLIKTE